MYMILLIFTSSYHLYLTTNLRKTHLKVVDVHQLHLLNCISCKSDKSQIVNTSIPPGNIKEI